MSKASDNTKARMNKQIRRIHSVFSQFSLMYVHDLLVFFVTLVKF